MTTANADSGRVLTHRYGNPIVECDGAQMRAQCRQLATVVTISGHVDALNVDRVARYATRYVLTEKPFILDLGEVRTFSPEAMALLWAVEQACTVAGVQWCLVAGDPVAVVLEAQGEPAFATAYSVPEALNYFLEGMLARRRLLPILHKTA